MKKYKYHKTHKNKNIKSYNEHQAEEIFNSISGRVHHVSARVAGNLRFSIKLRIALAHVWLTAAKIPIALLLIAIATGVALAPSFVSRRDAALSAANEAAPETQTISIDKYTSVIRRDRPSESTFIQAEGESGEPLISISILFGYGWGAIYIIEERALYVTYQGDGWLARFVLEGAYRTAACFAIAFGVVWLLLAGSIMHRGQRTSAELLAPIGHIADTARQLTEKNLSMRINVAGTQNELRDLAMMVNGMLDRIESAYNRQKQFVSDASHELRTPIAVLQGYANLLDRWGKDAPDVRDEAIAAILNETESMKELVENLLFLARHDKKTLALEPEMFSAAELVLEMVKETELIAKERRAEPPLQAGTAPSLQIEAGAVEECTLFADRSAIKQALRIFIDNAIKYTKPGGFISISCRAAGGRCYIAVRDTGMGIRKEDLPRVFDRFYRADQARSAREGGHGLGLSIARIIVSSHGGVIHVRSKPGAGSTFTIELPI
ncbi:MAG: HAMP domain-containing histidine kinase [Oscillospiraceae bacterium]|jgi:signal transduction histidine kinase|nr:HAMP domain-containing histidine kinase [Oscillospiraceae bacterium]